MLIGLSGGGGERRAARQHDPVFKKIIDIVIVVNTIIFILIIITISILIPILSLAWDDVFYIKAHVDIMDNINEAHGHFQVVWEGGQVVRPRKQGELFIWKMQQSSYN